MAEITLKAYLAHIDDLLGRRAYEEAQGHCKHILAKYPKHVHTLVRLGKAQLEAGHNDEAERTYSQVLAMDPRSVDAYVGLSWVTRQRNQGEQTIALLERAFEQDTNNLETVQLLRDAHRTFNDRANAKLPQTPLIAARQQWRSGLGQQAVATLNTALAEDAGRADIRLLKAQIQMAMGDSVEAARTATEVLKQLPDCIEANILLGEFWRAQGRPSDAQRFLSRVESADPYLAFEVVSGTTPQDHMVMLEMFDFRRAVSAAATAGSPDWLDELEDSAPAEQAAPSESDTPETDMSWLSAAAPAIAEEEAENAGMDWLDSVAPEAGDLSWLENAPDDALTDSEQIFAQAAEEPAETDVAPDFFSQPPAGDVPETAQPAEASMEWLEDVAADDGETVKSSHTAQIEEEIRDREMLNDLLRRTDDELAAVPDMPDFAALTQFAEEPTASDEQADEPVAAQPEDFGDFLKNYTSFGDLTDQKDTAAESPSGTGLTGLLSGLEQQDEESADPDVADIDPEDPLGWMRAEATDEQPPLSSLIGAPDEPQFPPQDEQTQKEDEAALPMDPRAELDPLDWLKEHDVELVEEQTPSLWEDPLGVEQMGALDQSEIDPLEWMKEAGVVIEDGEQDDPNAVDPLAWAKDSGMDLLEEVGVVNFTPTAQLILDEDGIPVVNKPEAEEEPQDPSVTEPARQTGLTGMLAYVKEDDDSEHGDSAMSDQEMPDWMKEPEEEEEQPKAESGDLDGIDWLSAVPSEADTDADADVDWEALPAEEAAKDAPAPDWLAALDNPVDASEAADLSAKDDPSVADQWEAAADEQVSEDAPDWMRALADEPSAQEDEPAASGEAAEWLFSDAEPPSEEAVKATDDLLAVSSDDKEIDWTDAGADSAEAEIAASLGENGESLDWLNADLSPEVTAAAPEPGEEMPDWMKAVDEAEEPAAVAPAAASGETPDWMSALEEAEDSVAGIPAETLAPAEAEAALDFDAPILQGDGEESEAADDLGFLYETDQEAAPAPQMEVSDTDEAQPSFELSYIEDEEPTEDVATVELEGDPLPDWLVESKPAASGATMDVDVPKEQLEQQDEIAGEILDDADLLEAEPPAPEVLSPSAATNAPDWLNAMVPGLEIDQDTPADDMAAEEEYLGGGKGDFDWLFGIVEEELAPPAMAAPARRAMRFPFSEPPAWLTLLREETQSTAAVMDMDMDADEDGLPDWLNFDDDAEAK